MIQPGLETAALRYLIFETAALICGRSKCASGSSAARGRDLLTHLVKSRKNKIGKFSADNHAKSRS